MPAHYDIEPYDPCPCGSGKKYKFCCAGNAKGMSHGKFPIGTVAYYGPDDKTITKIAAGVVMRDGADPIMRRWLGDANIAKDEKVAAEIRQFFARHGVKSVGATAGVLGCPHEEGIDFPRGQECPFCPFWHGKQGIMPLDDNDDLEIEELGEFEDDEFDEEDEDFDDESVQDDEDDPFNEDRDWDSQFARVDAILGEKEMDQDEAIDLLLAHLKANLQLPCEVTGTEDFRWEEPYVFGAWARSEYKELKKTQPSFTDRFELLSLDRDNSEWKLFDEDIAAHVRRKSDGKEFVLGLAELKATDKTSPNYQLLDDYSVWLVNSR